MFSFINSNESCLRLLNCFYICSEVFKALNKTRGLYLRWREIGDITTNVETEWTTTELKNSLRSIEWDLEDLEDTIYILFKYFMPFNYAFSYFTEITYHIFLDCKVYQL